MDSGLKDEENWNEKFDVVYLIFRLWLPFLTRNSQTFLVIRTFLHCHIVYCSDTLILHAYVDLIMFS